MTPALPPEVPPGMPEYAYDAASASRTVISALDECGAVAERYLSQLKSMVSDCLLTCGGTWASCESCVVGKVNDQFVRAGTVAQKCVSKIIDRAQVLFNQSQALTEPVIGQMPDLQTIVAAKLVGVAPPTIRPATLPDAEAMGNSGRMPPPGNLPLVPNPAVPIPAPPTTGTGDCPPGSLAQWNQDINGNWYVDCVSETGGGIGGHPSPPPPAPICAILPPGGAPTCPVGTHPVDEEGNTVAFSTVCADDVPTCPQPGEPCPPGFEWEWVPESKAWQCRWVSPKPSPPTPLPEPGTLDFFGLTNWNRLQCPDFTAGTNETTGQQIAAIWDTWIGVNATRLEQNLNVGGGGVAATIANVLAHETIGAVGYVVKTVGDIVVSMLFKRRDCDYLQMAAPVAGRALLGLIEAYTHVGFTDIITNLSYAIDRACPTLLPGQPGIDAAFMGNQITQDTWKCWTRAVNDLDQPAYSVLWAGRNQPNAEQWIIASQRDIITPVQLQEKLRGVGILDQNEAAIFTQLMQQLPGAGDIVRFMVRNTEDPNIVAPPPLGFGLDAEFDLKYQGVLKQWAKGQGLPDDVMLRFWRAHWQIPSPSQLYVMLQRLRPDNHPNLAVEVKDVLRALGENDVLPFWRERLIEVAYRLPRTSVAYSLFDQNIWDEKRLVSYYRDYGYSEKDAKDKVQVDVLKKDAARDKVSQLVTKANVSKAYIDGAIGAVEALQGFNLAGMDLDQRERALTQATFLRVIAQRRRMTKAIKCRFAACGLSQDGAVGALVGAGWDTTDAVTEVSCWKQTCDAKGKEPTTAMLCDWYGLGLLSDTEYRVRLSRLGWSRDDITRIIGKCVADQQAKAAKAAKAANKNGAPTTAG